MDIKIIFFLIVKNLGDIRRLFFLAEIFNLYFKLSNIQCNSPCLTFLDLELHLSVDLTFSSFIVLLFPLRKNNGRKFKIKKIINI